MFKYQCPKIIEKTTELSENVPTIDDRKVIISNIEDENL